MEQPKEKVSTTERLKEALAHEHLLVTLLQDVAAVTNQATDIREATRYCLKRACEVMDWPVGHAYFIAEDNSEKLVSSDIWHVPAENSGRFDRFIAVTARTPLTKGRGLPGRVLETGRPVWISDVESDLNFPRARQMIQLGVKTGFGFPVLIESETVAILEFFSDKEVEADRKVLDTMAHLGALLGRTLERSRAARRIRESEFRVHAIERAFPEGLISADGNLKIFSWNEGAKKLFGYEDKEIDGRSIFELVPERYREVHQRAVEWARHSGDSGVKGNTFQLRGRKKDGSEFPMEISLSSWKLGGEVFFTSIVRDLSEKYLAEALIRRQHEFSQSLITGSLDGIFAFDRECRFTEWNPAMERFTGISQSDVIGKIAFEMFPFLRESGEAKFFFETLAGRTSVTTEGRTLLSVSKHPNYFEGHYSPLTGESGEIIGGIAIIRDVTERKRRQERDHFLSQLGRTLGETLNFEEIPEKVASSFLEDYATACLIRFYGTDQLPPLGIARHRDPRKQHLLEELADFKSYGGTPHSPLAKLWLVETPEFVPHVPDSLLILTAETKDHLVSLRELEIRSYICVPIIAHDHTYGALMLISSTHHYDHEDLAMAQEACYRLGTAVENASLYRKAQNEIRTREDFIAVASHDLKNPISVIIMNAQMLANLGSEKLRVSVEIAARSLAQIRYSADRISGLIDHFLNVARISSGRPALNRGSWSVPTLMEDMLNVMRPLLESKRQSLNLDVPENLPMVDCDRERIYQVLSNLIGNSVKFTHIGGAIRLAARTSDGFVEICIFDNGPGIPARQLPHIFDRFWQGGNRDRPRGSGLGLAIAKTWVEAHGGQIWAESEPGKGTVMRFTIPIAKAKGKAQAA